MTKTAKSVCTKHISMSDEVHEFLLNRKEKHGYVFTIRENDYLRPGNCLKQLHKICELAGLRKIGWHCCRHSLGTRLSDCGSNPRAVQEILGHSDLRLLNTYVHVSSASLKATIGILKRKGEAFCQQSVNMTENDGGISTVDTLKIG